MDDAPLLEAVHRALLGSLLALEEGDESPRPEIDAAKVAEVVADRARFTRAAAGLALGFASWLRERNQFVLLSAEEKAALVALFAQSLRALARDPGAGADDHARRLAAWLRIAWGGLPPEVESAEYSAELQLSLLGIQPDALMPPVLDLGCGVHAHLLHHLRGLGVEAYGVDPDSASEWVIGSDWLGFDYGKDAWGTVLSHQAFSLHFLHHHFRRGEAAQRFGVAYMAILAGLKPGGSFVYAPALPFIEALLPEAYRVERRPLPAELAESLDWVKTHDPRLEVAFTSHVRREEREGKGDGGG